MLGGGIVKDATVFILDELTDEPRKVITDFGDNHLKVEVLEPAQGQAKPARLLNG